MCFGADRLALWRERRTRRLSAAAVFRSTIIVKLKGLYPSPVQWPTDTIRIIDVLEAKFPTLESAAVEFRKHLSWLDKRRFDKAWTFYCLGKDGRPIVSIIGNMYQALAKTMKMERTTNMTQRLPTKPTLRKTSIIYFPSPMKHNSPIHRTAFGSW